MRRALHMKDIYKYCLPYAGHAAFTISLLGQFLPGGIEFQKPGRDFLLSISKFRTFDRVTGYFGFFELRIDSSVLPLELLDFFFGAL